MRIAMIGTGYVGLVSGVCFSDFGHDVVCVDRDEGKIARLNRGEVPIYEPGLDDLLEKNVAAGRLQFTIDLSAAMKGAEVVFIANWQQNGDHNLVNLLDSSREDRDCVDSEREAPDTADMLPTKPRRSSVAGLQRAPRQSPQQHELQRHEDRLVEEEHRNRGPQRYQKRNYRYGLA
jgi:UDPglucose 6-dehydrogenase